MIRIYPEQLVAQLQRGLHSCYLLCGNEPLLLQESQDSICQIARQQGFSEHVSIVLDAYTEWEPIFSTCQALSLFARRQILRLALPESGVSASMSEQLIKLIGLLHNDILFILRGAKLTKAQEKSAWFKALNPNSVYISCQAPEQTRLPLWVTQRAKNLNLELDESANRLLCYCYEGNLLALSQVLEQLSLRYPDGKLTLSRVEKSVNDAARFTPYHWIDALLAGDSRRAWHILQQLRVEECEPVILLRHLQRELLLLLHLKRRVSQVSLRTLFDQHNVWQNRRNLMTQTLQRLSMQQLQRGISLLAHTELQLKQEYGQSVWPDLATLSMLLCGEKLPESFFATK